MASIKASNLGIRQVQRALRRGVNTVLVANGIAPSTRRGNKELSLAVQRLAQQPYDTRQEATQAGAALGEKIVELSNARGKTSLDGGVVRQMMLTGEIPTVAKTSQKLDQSAPTVVSEPKSTPPVADAKAVEADPPEAAVAEAEMAEIAEAEVADLAESEVAEVAEVAAEAEAEPLAMDAIASPTPAEAAVESGETVDGVIAEAPDAEAIAVLEPEAIDAPAAEPLVAADAAAAAAVETADPEAT